MQDIRLYKWFYKISKLSHIFSSANYAFHAHSIYIWFRRMLAQHLVCVFVLIIFEFREIWMRIVKFIVFHFKHSRMASFVFHSVIENWFVKNKSILCKYVYMFFGLWIRPVYISVMCLCWTKDVKFQLTMRLC